VTAQNCSLREFTAKTKRASPMCEVAGPAECIEEATPSTLPRSDVWRILRCESLGRGKRSGRWLELNPLVSDPVGDSDDVLCWRRVLIRCEFTMFSLSA